MFAYPNHRRRPQDLVENAGGLWYAYDHKGTAMNQGNDYECI